MHLLTVNWNVDPEIFALGPVPLKYYGVLLVVGFIAAYLVLRNIFRREQLSQQVLDSFAFTIAISTIIGLRLGHCLFYEPERYLAHPWEIILPFSGGKFIGYQGLASHGGAIGILLGVVWWCWKHKKNYIWALERVVIIVPLAGAFVRFGNLMNSEIYGRPTSLPWGFNFVKDPRWSWPIELGGSGSLPCHPTQIYEALAYLAIFFFMWYLYTKKLPEMKRGMLFGIFLILLFGVRFLVEFIKNDQVPGACPRSRHVFQHRAMAQHSFYSSRNSPVYLELEAGQNSKA